MATPTKSDGPLILVHGDDDFAVKQRARQVFQGWMTEADQQDQETIDAQAANSGEALQAINRLREALNTLPFFGGAKIIWWQHCNFLGDERTASAQAVTAALSDLAKELKVFAWDGVRLLISAGKVDKRKTFYKTLAKAGSVETYSAWSLEDRNWQMEAEDLASKLFRKHQLKIDDRALSELTTLVGPHREQLASEVEKLALYVGDRKEVTAEDVAVIVTVNKQAKAFALGDALGDRDLPRLLKTLDEELWEMQRDRKKSEIGLLYGLISKVRMMIFMKELQREKLVRPTRQYGAFKSQLDRIPQSALPEDRRFNPLAMNPYPLFRAMAHAENYRIEELTEAMEWLLGCNQALIFSSLDGSLLLQQTLVRIVQRHQEASLAQSA